MIQSYELFLRSRDGREWFVALTCEPEEVITLARRTLIDQDGVEGEVRQFGRSMFYVLRDGAVPARPADDPSR